LTVNVFFCNQFYCFWIVTYSQWVQKWFADLKQFSLLC
jgi:hypothetical protein